MNCACVWSSLSFIGRKEKCILQIELERDSEVVEAGNPIGSSPVGVGRLTCLLIGVKKCQV